MQNSSFTGENVKILQRKKCYDSFLKIDSLRLQHSLFEGGWSEPLERELLVKTPAVGVLLYDPEESALVMIRQFRVGMLDNETSPWPLELVAGLVDKDESLEQVAKREVKEETGLSASNFVRICNYYNSPGASSEKVALFCARVDSTLAGGVFGVADEHEDIQVLVLSEDQAKSALESGEINNAMSLIALQWLQLNKATLLAQWQ